MRKKKNKETDRQTEKEKKVKITLQKIIKISKNLYRETNKKENEEKSMIQSKWNGRSYCDNPSPD